MRLTPEMIYKLVLEYYSDPTGRGYFAQGNINHDGRLEFYVPQLAALANEPVVYKIRVCSCGKMCNLCDECMDCGNNPSKFYIKKIIKPPRINVIFNGIENAPTSLLVQDIIDAFDFFYTYIRPDDWRPVLIKE